MSALSSFAPLITLLTVVATAVMAASAAVQGVRQGFDPFGTTVLAIVTAVGGGTLRDLLPKLQLFGPQAPACHCTASDASA